MYLSWGFLVISTSSFTVLSGSVDQCSKAFVQPFFEFFTLSRNWPPTLCLVNQKVLTSKSCKIPIDVKTWTIHGLWPDIEKQPRIENCLPQQTFNYDKLKDIENELKKTWPSFHMPNDIFWQHEWCTHGSCAQDCAEVKGEAKYFRKAMELHNNYSVDIPLESASILPGNHYFLSDITKAIHDAFNVDPIVQCLTVNNEEFVAEIRICFQKDFTLMTCPDFMRLEGTHQCDPLKLIYYPEMHHSFDNRKSNRYNLVEY